MSVLAELTDEELAEWEAKLAEEAAQIYAQQSAIGIEQAKRRVAERYARWGNKKDDVQFDLDNEAEAQGVSTRSLLR